jgi:hypothetical protein
MLEQHVQAILEQQARFNRRYETRQTLHVQAQVGGLEMPGRVLFAREDGQWVLRYLGKAPVPVQDLARGRAKVIAPSGRSGYTIDAEAGGRVTGALLPDKSVTYCITPRVILYVTLLSGRSVTYSITPRVMEGILRWGSGTTLLFTTGPLLGQQGKVEVSLEEKHLRKIRRFYRRSRYQDRW